MQHDTLHKHPAWKKGPFTSGVAGKPSGVALRTVQSWVEKGLVIPVKEGAKSGDKHEFSVTNCVEIGFIKGLADSGLPIKSIKVIMDWLRGEAKHTLKTYKITTSYFLIIRPDRGGGELRLEGWIGTPFNGKLPDEWLKWTIPDRCERTIILNLSTIAKRVLDNI
ncbi:MerR family transcriptional regulator [Desulfosarcina variabilis]|uniref:MerR family transcriptional regulator n=1 Tax=Desulfosarcina variabilis TaxID=2300 RepID=UPI003AFA0D74